MSIFSCDECKSPLLPTPSGSVCPNGHGGLRGKLPSGVARANSALIAGIPTARMEGGHYYLSDSGDQKFKKGRQIYLSVEAMLRSSEHIAVDGDKVRAFEPLKEQVKA